MAFTAEEEAALRGIIAIYKSQAPSLSDDVAEIAPALYDQWTGDGHYYTAGERVEHGGTLYVCLQPHTSQADWTPAAAPSLWARNLAAADSPDATDVPAWHIRMGAAGRNERLPNRRSGNPRRQQVAIAC